MITRHRSIARYLVQAIVLLTAVHAGTAQAQSSKVALVTNSFVISGGNFPTTTTGPTGSFTSFTFVDIPVASLTLANLTGGLCGVGGCDTVVLSVGSSGLNCNVNGVLTATQKALLNTFVFNGGKLLIYDSECPSQNYTWLAYPFTTANPGPEGQRGLLNIVENNALSSNAIADTTYINEVSLETSGDAVGDGNVMTTQHPAWCLDMSATNSIGVTGPIHTYARYGSGLFIYAGFDLDPMGTTAVPNSANGSPGNLAKIWLQQLQVPFNPTPSTALPCGIAVIGITIAPLTATNDLGLGQTNHTVTATLTDLLGVHQVGVPVTISVTSGPNAGLNATISTNVNGQASFSYASNGTLGTDSIVACFLNQGNQVCSQVATKTWVQQVPQLSVTKTATPTIYAAVGAVIAYSYQVTNSGNVPVAGPFGVVDDKATVSCPATASLAPGASIVCAASYTIVQADLDAGAVTNVAAATGTFNGNPVTSQSATATVTAVRAPALTLDKSSPQTTVASVGDVIPYQYAVVNSGNVTLAGPFSVSDNKTTVACPAAATLAPGVMITCTASYTVTQADLDAGTVTNVASAAATFNGNPVTSPTDTATVTAVQAPALTIDKSSLQTTFASVGAVIAYQYVVANSGNVTLAGPFSVSDNKTTVTCPAAATLAPGATIVCTANYTVTQADLDAGTVTNTASAAGTFNGNPVTSPTDTATVTAVQTPALTIDKTATPTTYSAVGNVIAYSYQIVNSGNVTVAGPFTVTDDKATVTCPAAASLAPLASLTCTASYTITQGDLDAGAVTNVASGAGTFNGNPVTSPTDTATATAIQTPSLTIDKTATPTTYNVVGLSIAYSYLVTNNGNVTLAGPFTVADNKATATCPAAASLAPGGSITCSASYTITQADLDAGSVTNVASGRGTFNGNPVTSPTDTVTVTAVRTPALSVDKTATPQTYNAVGNVISYSYLITNSGNVTIAGPFSVADNKATVTCPAAANLAPAASLTCTASYAVVQADLDAGTLTNVASAAGTFNGNPVTSPTDTVTVTAVQTPSLTTDKTAAPATYNAVGNVITYTYLVTNSGNVTLTGPFTVSDNKVTVTCPATASLAPGVSLTCTASYTITQADLDAGSVTNVASAAGTRNGNPVTSPTDTATVTAVPSPALTIDKTATPTTYGVVGAIITYSYKVTNAGNVTLAGPFTVADNKVVVTCPATASLAPGAFITCAASYSIVQADIDAGNVTNIAAAAGTFNGNPVTSPPDTVVATAVLTPRLSLGKTANPTTFTAAGQTITYTLLASNAGNTALQNVTISDPLLGPLTCTPSQPVTLTPGQSLSCSGTYTVTPADVVAGVIDNIATVAGTGPQNQAVTATAGATVTAVLTPHLSLTKTANPIAYNAVGQVITYTIVATNDGSAPLQNVTITDPLIGALTCTPAQPATLQPAQTLTCTGTHVVTVADLAAGQLTNTAGVAGDPPNGIPGSVVAQAQVNVPAVASDVLGLRLALTACTLELQQDWTPRYTLLQFEIWNEDEVKFTGAFECADSWHETSFGADFDASRQNFTQAVLGTDTAKYRVQGVTSTQCPGARAVGILGVQSMLIGPNLQSVGSTLAGAGKFPGSLKWDPREFVPEGGIK